MAGHTRADNVYEHVMEEKRMALLSHLLGVCEFPTHIYYKKCHHPEKKSKMDSGKMVYI